MATDALGLSDLVNFNNSVTQTDPWYIAGQSLNSWKPDYSTWSPAETGITAFAKSFLSGLMGNMARSDAADQLSRVVSVLPQLGTNPAAVAVPEGVDAGAFNTLKGASILNNFAAQKAAQQSLLAQGIVTDPNSSTPLQDQILTALGKKAAVEKAGTISGQLQGILGSVGGGAPAAASPVAAAPVQVGENADGTPIMSVPDTTAAPTAAVPGSSMTASDLLNAKLEDLLRAGKESDAQKAASLQAAAAGLGSAEAQSALTAARKTVAGDKIPALGVEKISTGATILDGINKLQSLADQMKTSSPYGSVDRLKNSLIQGTPEQQYQALLTQVEEMASKQISNTARWPIVKANMDNASIGLLGSVDGMKTVLQNLKDLVAQDVKDHAATYGDAGYKKLTDVLSSRGLDPSGNPLGGGSSLSTTTSTGVPNLQAAYTALRQAGKSPQEIGAILGISQ